MVSVVAQNIIEAVVVAGIRSFAALSHPERERLIDAVLRGGETVRVDKDAVSAVVRAVDDYFIALFYVPHLDGVGHAVFYHNGAVHAAAREHLPLAVYLEIFGIYRSRVKILRDVAVPGLFGCYIGEGYKRLAVEFRGSIFFRLEHSITCFYFCLVYNIMRAVCV